MPISGRWAGSAVPAGLLGLPGTRTRLPGATTRHRRDTRVTLAPVYLRRSTLSPGTVSCRCRSHQPHGHTGNAW